METMFERLGLTLEDVVSSSGDLADEYVMCDYTGDESRLRIAVKENPPVPSEAAEKRSSCAVHGKLRAVRAHRGGAGRPPGGALVMGAYQDLEANLDGQHALPPEFKADVLRYASRLAEDARQVGRDEMSYATRVMHAVASSVWLADQMPRNAIARDKARARPVDARPGVCGRVRAQDPRGRDRGHGAVGGEDLAECTR